MNNPFVWIKNYLHQPHSSIVGIVAIAIAIFSFALVFYRPTKDEQNPPPL